MISFQNALRSVTQFIGSDVSDGFDLDDAQVDTLAKRLTMRCKVDIVMSPEAILPFAAETFPELVKDDEPPKQQKQTREQAIAVITAFLNNDWASIAPGCLLPTVSKINHKLFFDGVNASANRNGFVRRDHLADIAGGLFQRGLLEKIAAPAEPPPPPPPPPTENDLNNKRVAFEQSLNDPTKSPIRGAKENALPLVPKVTLTEEQKQAANEKAARDNAIVNEALSRISNFAGASHSRTYSGRAALRSVFQAAMDEGKPAEEVLRAVEAEANRLAGNSSIR